MHTIDLAHQSPSRIYDLTAGLIIPRPIAFVSSLSATGTPNLAPFSYFNIGGINPPSLTICTVLGPHAQEKDTYKNIVETKEFVVNLVTRSMAEGMNQTSPPFPTDVNEWPLSGFTPLDSHHVKPARVAESPIQLECRLHKTVTHGDGPGASRYVIGEILLMHLAPDILIDNEIHPANLIARLGNAEYLDLAINSRFELERPSLPDQ
ncbi:MAG: flavin reductase family protein [Fimbriimonadaceae bacterium]